MSEISAGTRKAHVGVDWTGVIEQQWPVSVGPSPTSLLISFFFSFSFSILLLFSRKNIGLFHIFLGLFIFKSLALSEKKNLNILNILQIEVPLSGLFAN